MSTRSYLYLVLGVFAASAMEQLLSKPARRDPRRGHRYVYMQYDDPTVHIKLHSCLARTCTYSRSLPLKVVSRNARPSVWALHIHPFQVL